MGLVHLIGAVGLAGIVWQWQRAERNALAARGQRDVAEGRAYAAHMRLAHAEYREGKLGSAHQRLDAWIPARGQSDWRGFAWQWLHRLSAASPSVVMATNANGFTAVATSADGNTLALGAQDGTVRLSEVSSGAAGTSWRAHPGGVDAMAFIPGHANWLATVGGDDELLKIWDVREPRLLATTNCSRGLVAHVVVSRTGRFLAAGAPEGYAVHVWELTGDPVTGLPRLRLHRT